MLHDGQNWVKQKHAARLRETLSWVYKYAPNHIKQKILDELKVYSENVKPYCTHKDEVYANKENKIICLDCGNKRQYTMEDGESPNLELVT